MACLQPIEPKTKTIHKDKKNRAEIKQEKQHIKQQSMAMLKPKIYTRGNRKKNSNSKNTNSNRKKQ